MVAVPIYSPFIPFIFIVHSILMYYLSYSCPCPPSDAIEFDFCADDEDD